MAQGRVKDQSGAARVFDVLDGIDVPRRSGGRGRDIREIPETVSLGRGARIDADARLGVVPPREPGSPLLRIGRDAVVRSGAVIYAGNVIGDGLDAGHNVIIHEDSVIGHAFEVGANTVIDSSCVIGDRVRVGANCYIASLTTLEDDVTVGSGAIFADDPHPGSLSHLCARGPVVRRSAQIGMNATILPAVVIGARSFVGAGSVVTADVAPAVVVVGSPARPLKAIGQVVCPLDLQPGQYLQERAFEHKGAR